MEKFALPITCKALIGLGNPGARFEKTRHNIGFAVLDALATTYSTRFRPEGILESAQVQRPSGRVLWLIKPQTFMNDSGKIASWLAKKGITSSECVVIHDELEKPFGSISYRQGGSARGHNGLKSLIELFGNDFWRVRFGIGRPAEKNGVADYVLARFSRDEQAEIPLLIDGLIAQLNIEQD